MIEFTFLSKFTQFKQNATLGFQIKPHNMLQYFYRFFGFYRRLKIFFHFLCF
jgi:hypothetical protein